MVAVTLAAVMIGSVIRATDRLRDFERWYAENRTAKRSYDEALAIFTALWRHARQLSPGAAIDWREDVASDIELARVLNGLPTP